MNTKHVYFVRHGESVANKTGIRQGPETPLTELGRNQAEQVGKRLSDFAIERIIKSPYVRTKQTASAIEQALPNIPVTESALFVERRNPSIMRDRHDNDEVVRAIWNMIEAHYHIPDWHHSDEENFADLRGRAQQAIAFLETLPEEHILVVTHGLFMKMLFAHILLGEQLDGRTFWNSFVPTKNVANTGIMHCEYTENFHKTAHYWKLVSWNDHAHLE